MPSSPSSPTEPKVALLLEGVNQTAVDILTNAGYKVVYHKKALPYEELSEQIKSATIIGIRSKTKLTADVLKNAERLRAVGCFCIGTNQVDLDTCAISGVPVFNSPFSNSRSVAELVLAEMIALSRRVCDVSAKLHQGEWVEVSRFSQHYEIRGKTLGVVGYGHIGSQLSVLADSMGMKVVFYDILSIMPLGSATQCETLDDLLKQSDYVTLHVPETSGTKLMVGMEQFKKMKKGAVFINASRGSVVDLEALSVFLKNGHLAGAAVDVYPSEPFANGPGFETVLQNCPNTILTPHIGGSTEEAQVSIGKEVANSLVKFGKTGSTMGCVNLPQLESKIPPNAVRMVNFHHNVPGVLRQVNKIMSGVLVEKQHCESSGPVSYLMADFLIEDSESWNEDLKSILEKLKLVNESITTRLIVD